MSEKKNPLKNLILISEVGLAVIVPVVLMVFLGVFLRNRFDADWLLIVCILTGLTAGLLSAWKLLKRFAPKPSEDEKQETYDLMRNWHEDGHEK